MTRDRPIMLIFYLLCYAALLINLPIMLKIMLKNKNCAQSIITICIQIYMNKSLLVADNVERPFY